MARQKLTKTMVEAIPPAHQDVVVWDESLPGFGLHIKPTGVRSYIVQYRNRHTGASKRMTIGQHGPLLTFEQSPSGRPGRFSHRCSPRPRPGRGAQELAQGAPPWPTSQPTTSPTMLFPKKRPRACATAPLHAGPHHRAEARVKEGRLRSGGRDIEAIHVALRDRPYQANGCSRSCPRCSISLFSGTGGSDNPAKGIKR